MENFPAGLFNGHVEIFGHDFKVHCLQNGQKLQFNEFPEDLRNELADKYENHPTAKKSLQEWGIAPEDQLEHFTFCMYAGFDHVADFHEEHGMGAPEYHNHCGKRGDCKYENKCCSGLVVQHGKLTPREIEVAGLIGKCYSDKLICFELEISQDTLRNHKNSIERKAGVFGKVGIAIIAHKYKLI